MVECQIINKLPRSFYARETVEVARDLIGRMLVRKIGNDCLVGRIIETEAYRGLDDSASHARNGKTKRNAPMFGPPGYTYIYFIYGMHWLFNLSAHIEGHPGAILIRALTPVLGVEKMQELRGVKQLNLLTNGPARLAQAFKLDKALNNVDLVTHPEICIISGNLEKGETIASGPRVRVPGDACAKKQPWRFWIEGHPNVST